MFAAWQSSFRNVTEVPRPVRLAGAVPPSLRGTLHRCGPGVFDEHGSRVRHPFDGDGYVAAYRFADGAVTYQARVVQTAQRAAELRSGRRLSSGAFGTPPALRAPKNAANTNAVAWGGHVLVFHEAGAPHVLSADTLETVGTLPPFRQGVPLRRPPPWMGAACGDAVCAHPKVERHRLVLFSLTYSSKLTDVAFYEFDRSLALASSRTVSFPGFVYAHDFAVTPESYLLLKSPLKLDLSRLAGGVVSTLSTDPRGECALVVVPRDGGAPESVAVPVAFSTHLCAARADEHTVELLHVAYDGPFPFHEMQSAAARGRLMRTTWNARTRAVTQRVESGCRQFEFPCLAGGAVYGLSGASLVRAGSPDAWFCARGAVLGEPVLVGDTHLAVEHFDSLCRESSLLVFDKDSLAQGPVGRVVLPHAAPLTLHGSWVDAVSLLQGCPTLKNAGVHQSE